MWLNQSFYMSVFLQEVYKIHTSPVQLFPGRGLTETRTTAFFKCGGGIPGAQPSVCSIPATWRSQWRRSRRSRLSTTSWWRCRSWRRSLMFWESWEKHSQSWKVSHVGTSHILRMASNGKPLFPLVDSLLSTNYSPRHWLSFSHPQPVCSV